MPNYISSLQSVSFDSHTNFEFRDKNLCGPSKFLALPARISSLSLALDPKMSNQNTPVMPKNTFLPIKNALPMH